MVELTVLGEWLDLMILEIFSCFNGLMGGVSPSAVPVCNCMVAARDSCYEALGPVANLGEIPPVPWAAVSVTGFCFSSLQRQIPSHCSSGMLAPLSLSSGGAGLVKVWEGHTAPWCCLKGQGATLGWTGALSDPAGEKVRIYLDLEVKHFPTPRSIDRLFIKEM